MRAKRDVSVQTSALTLGACAWVVATSQGVTSPAWALAGYLGAWFVVGNLKLLSVSRAGLVSVVAFSGLLVALSGGSLVDGEAWGGTAAHLSDQARLQARPAIAPSVVHGDHPQTFYIWADDAADLRLRLGPGSATLETTSLGHGLFRADYDPRLHGPAAEADGPVQAQLLVSGGAVSRELHYVAPLAHPRGLCTSPGRSLAASPSLESDELFIVDGRGRVHAHHVGDGPTDCVFLGEGRIAVSHRFTSTLWVLSTGGELLRQIESLPARRMALSSRRLALAHAASVTLLDVETFEPRETLEVADADWFAFTDEGTLLVTRRRAADVLRFRRGEDGEWYQDASLALGRPAIAMAKHGDNIVVSTTDYVPSGEAHLGNHFVQDQLLTISAAEMRVVNQRMTARRSERQTSAGNVDRGISPLGLDADGEELFVAFAGSDETWTLQGDGPPEIHDTQDIPAPFGIAHLSGSVVVTSPSAGLIATRRSGGWRVVRVGADSEDSPRRRGERAFYEGTRAGISCQSCHLHGDTDFVLRNIGGERLAPTLGVGGIADTSPFLRDGSYPRIRDLDHLATTLFRGYLRRDARRGIDIEAFVRSLPRRPVRRGLRDEARELRGVEVFVRSACTTCHSFPAFTNLAQVPAGALFPETGETDAVLDTPSLLSVGTHSPYLSDGRAESLESVFRDHNPSNRHGDTRRLSDEELSDLIYFLEGL